MFYRQQKQQILFQRKLTWQARQLRSKPTAAEQKLWSYLRRSRLLGYKFRRQFAIQNYIADFYCHDCKLIVEVDGEIHRYHIGRDRNRDLQLNNLGYTVIRFTNEDVLRRTTEVLGKIASLLKGGGGPANGGDGEGKNV